MLNSLTLLKLIISFFTFTILNKYFVNGSEEFPVYRMQQFDLLGSHYGSRSTIVNFEARTINSKSFTRKSVLIRLNGFNIEKFRSLVQQSVGAIIIALPYKYDEANKENIKFLEANLLKEEIKVPVYFILETPELTKYFDYIDNEKANDYDSAFQALVNSVATNGFQFVVNSQQSQPISDFQAINLQGKLTGRNNDDLSRKTIVISATYDALGLATSLAYGCDSNGSGVVALMELSRLLSYLYANMKTIPEYNIVFLLTAAGKFNYFGTKKWLDEQSDANDIFGKVELEDIVFAVSLDSIGNGDELFMHVSKPPKENQQAFEFLNKLEKISPKHGVKFQMNHKKINLASEMLAWEHERFSLSKVQGLTLSHFGSHKDTDRTTMTDTRDSVNDTVLVRNIKVIAESLGKFIYNISDDVEIFSNEMEVSPNFISSSLNYVCSIPRSASLLNKNNPLINTLHSHFTYYLKDPLKFTIKPNAKEPEFVFFNEEQSTLVIYNVKPAIFDLFLAFIIALYLFLVYLFVSNFSIINNYLISLANNSKSKAKTN